MRLWMSHALTLASLNADCALAHNTIPHAQFACALRSVNIIAVWCNIRTRADKSR